VGTHPKPGHRLRKRAVANQGSFLSLTATRQQRKSDESFQTSTSASLSNGLRVVEARVLEKGIGPAAPDLRYLWQLPVGLPGIDFSTK
jgi:hypothetical protein